MFVYSLLLSALAEPSSDAVTTKGNLRVNVTSRPGFVVDFEGRDQNLVSFWIHVFDLDLATNGWNLEFGGDLLDGQFAGAPWNLEGIVTIINQNRSEC